MKNKDGTVIYVPPPGTLLCLDPVGFPGGQADNPVLPT